MKIALNHFSISLLILGVFAFAGCRKEHRKTITYQISTPILESKAAVLADIKANTPHVIKETGKIYIYQQWIFLNEPEKGVHLIDNTNPVHPQLKAFIPVPGNNDIAVKGSTLYVDMYSDLLAIDISDPMQPKIQKTLPDIFPDRKYMSGYYYDSTKIIVGYNTRDTTVEVDDGYMPWPVDCLNCMFMDAASGAKSSPTGQGGSMARFAVVENFLYTVSLSNLSAHDIRITNDPQTVHTNTFGWGIETVYPFKDKLFIGSSTGMFIADISTPQEPSIVGRFDHARVCDPVVADDKYAYVTLRSSSGFCPGTTNELDIVDIAKIEAPFLVKNYPLTNPHGLGKQGDFLYICDGDDGLKVYDASAVAGLKKIQHVPMEGTYDVIINNDLLLLVAKSGLHQYKIGEDGKLLKLSTIKIER